VISSSQRPLPDNTQHTNIHAPGGIRTDDLRRWAAADLRLRPRGHWDRHPLGYEDEKLILSHYRPDQTLRFGLPLFLDNRHMKVLRLSALSTSRLYPHDISPLLISVRCWVDPRVIVRPEVLCQWKIHVTSGKEPATFQVVGKCLNQMCILGGTSAIIVNKHWAIFHFLWGLLSNWIVILARASRNKFRFW